MNNPCRFILSIAGGVGLVLALLACPTAYAVTVTYKENVVCGADAARPDHDVALRKQIAQTINGPIGYYQFGQGSPLILITGYRATLSEWNSYFLAELAREHQVIVFDNRGIGQSTMSVENYRVEDLAHDTAALTNALGLHSFSVLGWSMGGMIAQQLALDEPELVTHLILLSSAPPGRNSTPLSNRVEDVLSGRGDSSFDNVMKVLFPAKTVRRAENCFAGDMFRPPDYLTNTVSTEVTAAQESLMRNWALNDASISRLRRTKAFALAISGTSDEVLASRNSVTLSKIIPHTKLVEVKDGGHAMMYQYPRALADEINRFFSNSKRSIR